MLQKCIVCLKWPKINEQEDGVGPSKNIFSRRNYHTGHRTVAFHGKLRFNKWQFVTILPKLISDESLLCPCYDFAIFNFKNSNNIVFVVVLGFRFLFNQLLSNPKHTINNFLVVPRLWVKADCGWGRLYLRTSFIYKYKMLHGFVKVVSGGCFILINNWHYPQSGSDDFFIIFIDLFDRYHYLSIEFVIGLWNLTDNWK